MVPARSAICATVFMPRKENARPASALRADGNQGSATSVLASKENS
jgi:hypothetical protein